MKPILRYGDRVVGSGRFPATWAGLAVANPLPSTSPFSDVWAAIGQRDWLCGERALGGGLVQKPEGEIDREPELEEADSLLLGNLHLGR